MIKKLEVDMHVTLISLTLAIFFPKLLVQMKVRTHYSIYSISPKIQALLLFLPMKALTVY